MVTAAPTQRGPSVGFPLDQNRFIIEHNVPLLDEHEIDEPSIDPTTGKQTGMKTAKYTADVLQSMCNNMNARIEDTGDYCAISLGHTPDYDQRVAGQPEPEVLGFCGPFYVARIGAKRPRACIYAANWAIKKERYEESKKYPRRSVEIFREDNLHDRYFDPVAVLGGEMPARDLGLAYSRRHQGRLVTRYSSAAMAAAPSQYNTFLPGYGGDDRKRRYSKLEQQEGSEMALTDQDIAQIIEALMNTAEMQYVSEQMQSAGAKGDPTQVDPNAGLDPNSAPPDAAAAGAGVDAPPPGMDPAAAAPGGPPPGVDPGAGAPPPPAPAGAGGPPPGAGGPPSHDDDKDKKQRMSAVEAERAQVAARAGAAQQTAETSALQAQVDQLQAQLQSLQGESRRKIRYSRVEALASTYPISIEDELKASEELSDEAFDARLDAITRYGRAYPVGRTPIPVADSPKSPVHAQQQAEQVNERVHQLVTKYANAGVKKDFRDIQAEAQKELGITA